MNRVFIIAKVIPGSRSNTMEVIQREDDKIHAIIKVMQPPDKDKANRAVIELIAEWLNVAKSTVELIKGSKCRNKVFRVSSLNSKVRIEI